MEQVVSAGQRIAWLSLAASVVALTAADLRNLRACDPLNRLRCSDYAGSARRSRSEA